MSASFRAKIASIHATGFEKIIGCHEFLDGQTDSFSTLYVYIDAIKSTQRL